MGRSRLNMLEMRARLPRIMEAIKTPVEAELGIRVKVTESADLSAIEAALTADLFEIMHGFVKDIFVPRLKSEFDAKTAFELSPRFRLRARHIENPNTQASHFPSPAPEFEKGLRELKAALTTYKVTRMGSTIVHAGIGPYAKLAALNSSDYGPVPTNAGVSVYNSFFFAVEFGTGISENLGGATPRSKSELLSARDKNEDFDLKPPGAWVYGPLIFTGQQAMQLFYDQPSGRPQKFWEKLFREEFPKYVEQRVTSRLGR